MEMTGAQLTVSLLERQGVRTLAGIPGGANLPLYDALGRSGNIRHVLTRHEQGAGFVAQGMARVTGQPGVCFATSGPGATNIITAIADAKLDSIPVVCITGQVPTFYIGTDAFQEVDTYGMTIPATKHNFLVRSAKDLLEVVPQAFAIAMSGRPGPVLIDIPKDVQNEIVAFDMWPEPASPAPAPELDRPALEAAADMINKARRPVLCLGGGVVQAGAHEEAVRLAERCGLPVTTTLMGLGAIPAEHPLNIAMLGMHGARYTNLILEECDLFIAAGMRFDDRATGNVAHFCPDAQIIHIDIDASEIDKIKSAHVGIAADVRHAIEALLPMVEENPRTIWLDTVDDLRNDFPLDMPGTDDPRTPYGLIRRVAELAGDDAIVATDVGQHQMWTAQAYPFRRPRQWLTSGGLGTMGFGLPSAIGAALARPEAPVVCFSGDGSLLMNIQELATMVEENLNVKVVLLNNNALGLVHQQQDLFYGKRIYESTFRSSVDFIKIAQGFGVETHDLGSGDPSDTLASAFSQPGPCLIHAPIDVNQKVYPMVPPGAANKEMIGGESYVAAHG